MKVKVIITPIDEKGNQLNADYRWKAIYQDKKTKDFIWLTDQGQTFNRAKTAKDAKPDVLQIPKMQYYELTLESEGENRNPHYDDIINFIKYSPKAQPEGETNPNLIKADYRVVVDRDLSHMQYIAITEQRHVINRIYELSFEDLRDLAYSIGTDPGDLTHEALIVTLLGPTFRGDALLKKHKDERGTEILAVNYIRNKGADERQMIATVHKAIRMGIITFENGTYQAAGDRNLGETPEKAINYCKNNSPFYDDYLEPNVREKDGELNWEELKDISEKARISQTRLESQDKKKKSTPEVEDAPKTEPSEDAALLEEVTATLNTPRPSFTKSISQPGKNQPQFPTKK